MALRVPTYRVEFSPEARKRIRALDHTVRRRIDAAILKLESDPFPPGAKSLQGVDGYRVRVGDYRILYTVEGNRLLVLVFGVGSRGQIYKR